MKPPRTLVMAVVPALVGLTLASAPTYAGTHHGGQSRSTSFAFKSSGYGTHLNGGQLPGGSSTSGWRAIGCTNQAGRDRTNDVGTATLPGLGTASDIKTHLWTSARNGVVAAHSLHRIGRIDLVQTGLGSLALTAITSRATASHDASGFHAATTTHVGGLSFTPPIGPAESFPLPTPDQPLTIPGVATIYAGQHTTRQSATGSLADAYALRIDVIPTGSRLKVAHSHAELNSGMTGGLFGGHAAATHVVSALDGTLESGPNPLTHMPCQGTNGKLKKKSLANGSLADQLLFQNANSSERGNQGTDSAHGMSRASVGRVSLGGQVVIKGVVGKVSVTRHGKKVTKSTTGTQLGTVTVAGQKQTFPKTGVLEIPGVAKFERSVVTRTHNGIAVIGLRVTLLDGTGAVVDFGEASLKIGRLS
ncbi:MAG TPA: choice-of-anchor P family protein [Nocardioides sp.]|uniref:choice-of-anchor P family protein n=1 Tax=Nocardioides sp. TaxID=35761 RepID=UPI002E334DD8|nr:choice-of-anchor P family protein [Nocardioides sp.]HEX3931990.1 choice-of-anchor P family protein [Nocardioides sp.]